MRTKVFHFYSCDECNNEYHTTRSLESTRKKNKSEFDFCSNACKVNSRKEGGKLWKSAQNTSMKNWGVPSPMQSNAIKTRYKESFQNKYGMNVTSPMHLQSAQEKRKRTHLERYGFEETFQAEGAKAKRRKTWFEHYGVEYKPWGPEATIQSRLSMERMPEKWSSKVEEEMCAALVEMFGPIQRQKRVHKWPIDAYIPSIDTYVQLDGVYWHGLDRPIELIKESISPRDIAICQKWNNDREQETWFLKHGLTLFRITDLEFKRSGLTSLTSSILGRRTGDGHQRC